MIFILYHTMIEHWILVLFYLHFLCAGLNQKVLVTSTAVQHFNQILFISSPAALFKGIKPQYYLNTDRRYCMFTLLSSLYCYC